MALIITTYIITYITVTERQELEVVCYFMLTIVQIVSSARTDVFGINDIVWGTSLNIVEKLLVGFIL